VLVRARHASALVFAGGLGLALLPATSAFAAGSGYGPGTTGPSGVPGAFSAVVTAQTLGTAGGKVSAAVGSDAVVVSVPAKDFANSVEVVLTQPDISAIPNALAGLGVGFLENGVAVTSTFPYPVKVTISGGPGHSFGDF
jgi:hypothetical protein